MKYRLFLVVTYWLISICYAIKAISVDKSSWIFAIAWVVLSLIQTKCYVRDKKEEEL